MHFGVEHSSLRAGLFHEIPNFLHAIASSHLGALVVVVAVTGVVIEHGLQIKVMFFAFTCMYCTSWYDLSLILFVYLLY